MGGVEPNHFLFTKEIYYTGTLQIVTLRFIISEVGSDLLRHLSAFSFASLMALAILSNLSFLSSLSAIESSVDTDGFEPRTSVLSGRRSSGLNYAPILHISLVGINRASLVINNWSNFAPSSRFCTFTLCLPAVRGYATLPLRHFQTL